MDKIVKIYGERNTGTNYLVEMFKLNFEIKVLKGAVDPKINRFINFSPNPEMLRDLYFELANKYVLGWKHSEIKIDDFYTENESFLQKVRFIVLIKNPYSWLLSLYRRPYHYFGNKNASFENFLESPWRTMKRDNSRISEYRNPIDMWNRKNKSYIDLKSCFNVIIIKYEEMIKDHIKTLRYIEKALKLTKKNDSLSNFNKSTKDSNKDFDFYKDYYGNERWKQKLTNENIKTINSYLNKDLIKYFDYGLL
jgi:hypothetical protein